MAAQTGFDAWTGTAHMRKNFMRNAASDVFVNDQRTKFLFCAFVRPMGAFFVPKGEQMGNTGGKSEKRWWNRGKKLLFLCRRAMMNAKWAYYNVPWKEAL